LQQCVPISRVCDGYKDCADGTDEVPCNCLDRLLQYNSSWHCDGYHDCFDLGDEQCPPPIVCQGMYMCQLSRECIPHSKVCDANIDCIYGEDEMECLTLLKEPGKLALNRFLQPEHSSYGTLAYRGTSEWRPVCTEEISKKMMNEICVYLGYRNVKESRSVTGPTELDVVMPELPEYLVRSAATSRLPVDAQTSHNMGTLTRIARSVNGEPPARDPSESLIFLAELHALENRRRVKREKKETCPQ
ncbi:serine protease nudel-like, partial [Penaeus japonicus]|uniref:serine protease nudel-like n=1 Tax=Penaeus japonicus TaxID=27405 RepID=UPI001C70DFF7